MARLIAPDGSILQVTPDGPKRKFTLAQLQSLVGGYIEIVHGPKGVRMVVDEEGKLKGKPVNLSATMLVQSHLLPGDIIVGHALVFDKGDKSLS